jgi:hypothetical protein
MKYHDSIPRKDGNFDKWVLPFAAYIAANGVSMGIKPATMLALVNAVTNWSHAFAGVANPATTTSTAVSLKSLARVELEAVLRPLIRQIQADSATTDDMRTAMNINIPSGTHTRAAVPSTQPQLTLGNGQHQAHLLGITDVVTGSRPDCANGCKLYFKVGGPVPADISEMNLLDIATTSSYLAQYAGAQAGQTAYYRACWVNSHNETGPVSDLVSGTIIG